MTGVCFSATSRMQLMKSRWRPALVSCCSSFCAMASAFAVKPTSRYAPTSSPISFSRFGSFSNNSHAYGSAAEG